MGSFLLADATKSFAQAPASSPPPAQASTRTAPAASESAKAAEPAKAAPDAPANAATAPKPESEQNLKREKELADDTAKLLALANELKAEMDKSTKDTLSLAVLKKADQIERLAKKVRSEMKASIGN